VIAVLLYLKEALKSIVTKLSDVDVRAVMQFVPGVLFAIPAAENLLGSTGLYATAVVSGSRTSTRSPYLYPSSPPPGDRSETPAGGLSS